MATHSSNLAWKIPWTEEPGGYSPCDRRESGTTAHAHSPWRRAVRMGTVWERRKVDLHAMGCMQGGWQVSWGGAQRTGRVCESRENLITIFLIAYLRYMLSPLLERASLKSLGDQLQEGISAVSLSCWAPRAGKAHPVLGWPSWVRRCPL